MDNKGSNDDCYFYYYSSCTKGSSCSFRHCQAALGTKIVCSLWREGKCFRENCKFRHMKDMIRRTAVQCYFEDQASGCLKRDCVFLHRKPRPIIHSNLSSKDFNHAANGSDVEKLVKSTPFKPVLRSYSNIGRPSVSPLSHHIEPVIIRLDDEESDNESACSTPMKLDNLADKKANIGIKTLEQLLIEKMHREPEYFFKPAYDFDPISRERKNDSYKLECYPPESSDSSHHSPQRGSTFKCRAMKQKPMLPHSGKASPPPKKKVPLKKSSKENLLNFKIKTLEEIRKERENKLGTFKCRAMKQKPMLPHSGKASPPPKKFVPLKKSSKENLLNFKIKTLEEIRKERENKLGNKVEICTISMKPNAIENTSSVDNLNEKSTRRLKIKKHTESLQNLTIQQAGKRKECDDCPTPKQIRSHPSLVNSNDSTLDCTSNEMFNYSIVEEKQMKKSNSLIIKRKKSSPTPAGKPPAVTEKEIVNSANAPSDAVPLESLVITDHLKEKNKPSRKSMDKFYNFLNETEVLVMNQTGLKTELLDW